MSPCQRSNRLKAARTRRFGSGGKLRNHPVTWSEAKILIVQIQAAIFELARLCRSQRPHRCWIGQ